MNCIMTEDFSKRVGIDMKTFAKKSKLVEVEDESDMIHFFPTKQKGVNYTAFVENLKNIDSKESDIEIIKKYTFHDTWYCTKINLILAADSEDLKKEADYIKKLKKALFKRAKTYPVKSLTCFRGMQQSAKEFDSYLLNEIIYIPSFLSTSKNKEKFYMASNHNCLMEIKLHYPPNNAVDITEELSSYSEEEEEVLFGCYSKFKVVHKEKGCRYRGKTLEYYIILEHINQIDKELDKNTILMINFLGFH